MTRYVPPHLRGAPKVTRGDRLANARGFFGDLQKSSRIERYIFGKIDNTVLNFEDYDNIPVKINGANVPEPIESYSNEVLPEQLRYNLQKMQYTTPTPIQKHSISYGLAKRDIMACAQTGSGKTAAFLIPVIANLIIKGGNSARKSPQALVMAPTRELAGQIHREATKFCYGTGIATTAIYGGVPLRNQVKELERGVDIIVATPGRLIDLLQQKLLTLSSLEHLVVDEADRMLDMGFEPQIREVMHRYQMPDDCVIFMFSATFPKNIQELATTFLRDFLFISIGKVGLIPNDVELVFEWVNKYDKEKRIVELMTDIDSGLVLIFVETKRQAEYLDNMLHEAGFSTTSIHGDRSQRERQDALFSFKSGRNPILIATDVAARGLDVKGITHVVNYELPSNIDSYIHRIGRTGRIGGHGVAVSFYNESNRGLSRSLIKLLQDTKNTVPERLLEMSGNVRQRAHSFSGGKSGRWK
jgi:ATP-dependent RNA helicase DDX3X